MPRKPRLFVSGGIYHVYCRTHRGDERFSNKSNADFFIETVAEVSSAHQLTVLGFALMSNHHQGSWTFDDAHPELPPSPEESPDQLLVRACRVLGQTPAEITGASRRRSIIVARRRFEFIAICHLQQRGTVVARSLGKNPCHVSHWLAAEIEACSCDPAEASFIEAAAINLSGNAEHVTKSRKSPK